MTLPEPGLEVGAEGAGPHVGHERVVVDRPDAVQPGQVEGDAAEHRDGGTAHAAAAAGRGDRHPGLVADGQDGGHLAGVGGADHHGGPGRHLRRRPPSRWRAATSPVRPRPGPRPAPRPRRTRRPGARAGARRPAPGAAEAVGHPARTASIGVTGVGRSPGLPAATGGGPGVGRPAPAGVHIQTGPGQFVPPGLGKALGFGFARPSSHPSSGPMRAATRRAAAAAARASRSTARVRRASTSSSVRAISSPGGVDRLGAEVGQPGDHGLEQLRTSVGQGQHVRRLRAVAAGGGWRWRWPRPGRSPGREALPSGGPSPGPTAPLRAAGGPWWRSDAPAAERGDHGVDGVLRHLAVGRELAAGDRHHARRGGVTVWRRERSAVRSRDVPPVRRGQERAQAGPDPGDVGPGERPVVTALAASSR